MLTAMLLGVSAARAAEEPPAAGATVDQSTDYGVETIASGLDNPASVAVRPGSEGLGVAELFLSESGAGRVLRLATDEPARTATVITGFPTAKFSDEPAFRVGPLGLAFLSRNRLAVGTGGLGQGEDLVRVYGIVDGGEAIAYDRADHSAGPVAAGPRSAAGEGEFFSLATTDRALFAAPHSGDAQGWVLKATLDANRIAGLEPFISTKTLAGRGAPGAVAVNPQPQRRYLVVAERGEPTAEFDSRITMHSPTTGAVALSLNTGLRDIVALAYSPAPSFDLYAADYSLAEPSQGGVYRIEAVQVDDRESCRAVKIASITRPTSIAFTADGAMYVTAFGDAPTDEGDAKPAGTLLRITPQAGIPKL
jgi:hypothetical protein